MPHLSQKMVPPGDTIWWALPGAASGAPRPGAPPPGQQGPVPPMPRGYVPYPGQAPPGPSYPAQRSPAPAAKPQPPGPLLGAIALGLGIVLLVIGASSGLSVIVVGGLIAGAWGIWRLVTATGSGPKPPPGRT